MKRLYEVQKTKSVRQFVVFLLIVGGTTGSWKGINESHRT